MKRPYLIAEMGVNFYDTARVLGITPLEAAKLYIDKAGGFRFRLKARNGKIIAISESYTTKLACENGIESVKHNAPEAEIE